MGAQKTSVGPKGFFTTKTPRHQLNFKFEAQIIWPFCAFESLWWRSLSVQRWSRNNLFTRGFAFQLLDD